MLSLQPSQWECRFNGSGRRKSASHSTAKSLSMRARTRARHQLQRAVKAIDNNPYPGMQLRKLCRHNGKVAGKLRTGFESGLWTLGLKPFMPLGTT